MGTRYATITKEIQNVALKQVGKIHSHFRGKPAKIDAKKWNIYIMNRIE